VETEPVVRALARRTELEASRAAAARPLTWALVIATYRREAILRVCIELALAQTRRPAEIVVVDASEYWEKTRDHLMGELAPRAPDVRWIYVAAEVPSIALQRNQGIDLASADVLFLFDDDTLMDSRCAEEILRVYEADQRRAVPGIQAAPMPTPPRPLLSADTRKVTGGSLRPSQPSRRARLQRLVWRHVLLMENEKHFIPYEGRYPGLPVPPEIAHCAVRSARLFGGHRMTYRREEIARTRFDPALLYYSAGEDLDASYRVSLLGPIVTALEAKVHHHRSGSGRIGRRQVATLSVLNLALFLRRHATFTGYRARFYTLLCRRLLAELLKDVLSRRWSLPQARGILTAARHAPQVFATPRDQLTESYRALQRRMLASPG
jgi:GT2 family glycosyltransferase